MKTFQSFKVWMPGCEMSENFWKYPKSKPKMAEKGKNSKFKSKN